ncbi:MAG: DUF1127 domain-containing protein [Hyphomicrobiales bacterium]
MSAMTARAEASTVSQGRHHLERPRRALEARPSPEAPRPHRRYALEGVSRHSTLSRLLSWLKTILSWPLRVMAAQRELEVLAGMSEHELKDIGLTRSDLGDATALPADASPTGFLASRIEERYRARHG